VLSSAFPKGFGAFYCMKYEITQGQYTDFLNLLTASQAGNRYYSTTSSRYTIGGTWPNYTNGAPDRACNYLSWADGVALADWAGLRPLTELEFEKACRGPLVPVPNEYAWGSTTISATTAIENDGTGTETATGGNCNYNSCLVDGPYRAGIYATGSSSRLSAGASYWGIMELSGNLTERPVTLGNAAGRSFTGLHGNGKLDADGNADVSLWPNTTGTRGGTYLGGGGSSRAYVSDRDGAAYTDTGRYFYFGWRGARTAPALVEP